tara:strand:+ start:5789 stop:7183 length:1395 start_codon:yes stop_codon:yes gene_type:complete
MKLKSENHFLYCIIFLITLISGILNSIYYFEDMDSLRFATALKYGYDINQMQPHFPGYPVFHFIASLIYYLTNNIGITFSIIGSISMFFLIFSTINIIKNKLVINNILIALLILFNPLLSLMSSRYMPDLLGLATCSLIFYLIIYSKNKNHNLLGCFLCGILIGIRLSYFPLIIIPIVYSFIYHNSFIRMISTFILGIIVWLIPLIAHQGLESLYTSGYNHTIGHFTKYGGTIFTEGDIMLRIKSIFHTVWSDGFGGYWKDRSIITLLISGNLILIVRSAILNYNNKISINSKIIIFSIILYFVWILFFQNVIFKSRHIIPIIMLLIIIMFKSLPIKNYKKHFLCLIILWSILSINLNFNHKQGTAINKVKNYLQNKEIDYIISDQLMNYYMKRNGIKVKKKYIDNDNLNNKNIEKLNDNSIVFIGFNNLNIDSLYQSGFKNKSFFHNPYINRMWSQIPIFYNQ